MMVMEAKSREAKIFLSLLSLVDDKVTMEDLLEACVTVMPGAEKVPTEIAMFLYAFIKMMNLGDNYDKLMSTTAGEIRKLSHVLSIPPEEENQAPVVINTRGGAKA